MKFNLSSKAKATTVNYEGANAFNLTPEMELYTAIATTMLSDTSYESADDRLARIQLLVPVVKPEFTAKLAVYARKQMNLRTAPVVLATVEREKISLVACYLLFNLSGRASFM